MNGELKAGVVEGTERKESRKEEGELLSSAGWARVVQVQGERWLTGWLQLREEGRNMGMGPWLMHVPVLALSFLVRRRW